MVTFVRNHVDADDVDAPDSNLTVYARMAYNDILSRSVSWPHLEVAYQLSVVAGQTTYPLSGLSGGSDMDVVYSVIDTNGIGKRLLYITRADGDLFFTATSVAQSGDPVAYTVFNGNIVLYPTPAGSDTYTVRGFRNATTWPAGAGSVPDLPSLLHEAICWYMIANYYMAQEDAGLSQVYLGEYMDMVDRFVKGEVTRNAKPRPTVMGGQYSRIGGKFLDRVRGSLQ